VYLAEDNDLDRRVALKFLPLHLCQDEDCRKRFKREAQAAAKLDHPHIVPVYEVGEFQGRPFFAMAHIEGRSLREVIREGKLTVSESIEYTKQICEGLHKAHESGVVHRDIKPGNVIIDTEGRARIVDFGLATVSGEEKLTKTGSTLGTVGYMSPEQIQIEGKHGDHRSDVFSVGVMLYEMLTGRRPFEGETDAAVGRAITDTAPEPIARYKSGTTGELQQILDKALTKDPSLRYQHADGMIADLMRVYRRSIQTQTESSPSIAVLPFVNLSDDPGNEYFSDGLTEELISALVKIPNLHVAARTSTFEFKGKTGDIESIGHRLKVARVLEGSVRKAGNRVRITAQLIDVSNGFHLWSEKYDRDIEDIFAVQDDISQSVATALKVILLTDSSQPKQSPPIDPEVHNLVLEGMHFLRQERMAKSLRKAVGCFERAIEIDPESAVAWVGLAKTYFELVGEGYLSPSEYIDRFRDAVEHAVTLDDSLASAHCLLGQLKQYYELDWMGADVEFRRALELEPGNADLIRFAGRLAYATGRLDDAISLLTRGARLDPLNAPLFMDLGWSLLCNGRLKEAVTAYRRGLELEPDRRASRHFMGRAYLLDGCPELALEQMQIEPHRIWRLEGLALAHHALGAQVRAGEALDEILSHVSGWEFNVAEVYAFWGEIDSAFEWLERAREQRDGGVGQFTKTDPLFRNLHGDPRWNEFLSKIGLSP